MVITGRTLSRRRCLRLLKPKAATAYIKPTMHESIERRLIEHVVIFRAIEGTHPCVIQHVRIQQILLIPKNLLITHAFNGERIRQINIMDMDDDVCLYRRQNTQVQVQTIAVVFDGMGRIDEQKITIRKKLGKKRRVDLLDALLNKRDARDVSQKGVRVRFNADDGAHSIAGYGHLRNRCSSANIVALSGKMASSLRSDSDANDCSSSLIVGISE